MKILNELEYCENILKNGFEDGKESLGFKMLAKYYKSKGLDDVDIKKEIVKVCEEKISEFNMVLYYKYINNAVRYAKYENLFIVQPVRITQNEISKIQDIGNLKKEKVAFTLLVLSKINYQKQLCNDKYRDKAGYFINDSRTGIFKYAKLYVNKDQSYDITSDLLRIGLISPSGRKSYKVNFVDEDNATVITISNFKDFVLEYEKYIGENIGYCSECKCPIRITSNRSKYCRECWKEIRENQNKNKALKYYHKNKNFTN